jgi:MoxR-like ATPase
VRSADTGAGGTPPPAPLLPDGVSSPEDLADRLAEVGYLADAGVATAAYLTLALRRPLLLEGDAGVGKTAVAHALAEVLGAPLIRLQCYEGLDASQALYDWNFPRQVLHLRAAEVTGRAEATPDAAAALEDELYDRRFLVARPILQALETSPSVLLIDEVDRADDEFEALLLEVLSDTTVTVPELGTIRAVQPPVVVLTSNRTREVHDALKRRCYYHWVDHPSFDREVTIVRTRLPGVGERLAREVTSAVHVLREQDLLKPPGVAETLDWTEALVALGADHLDADRAAATLGSVLKFREDQERVRAIDVGHLVARAAAGG